MHLKSAMFDVQLWSIGGTRLYSRKTRRSRTIRAAVPSMTSAVAANTAERAHRLRLGLNGCSATLRSNQCEVTESAFVVETKEGMAWL